MRLNKKHYFKYGVVGILLLAVFLRFYKYGERWGLAYDQAHDALIAHYALLNFKIPLLGPFSSAGPFQTGGEWYWLIMLGTVFAPYWVLAPWIFITFLSVVFVGFIIYVAYKIAGKQYALIAGLLAAVSTAQILQGTNLTNQTPQALLSLAAIWCFITYIKKKEIKYLLLLGLSIGFASSVHLSGVGLIFLPVSMVLVYRKISFKGIGLLILGAVIPWLPVFIVDFQNNFINIRHMIQIIGFFIFASSVA